MVDSAANRDDDEAAFVERLLSAVPRLTGAYKSHVADNDGLLPHVFMGDVTRYAIAESKNPNSSTLAPLLAFLEDELNAGGANTRELIAVSFVENLLGETAALRALRPLMGLSLRNEVKRVSGL